MWLLYLTFSYLFFIYYQTGVLEKVFDGKNGTWKFPSFSNYKVPDRRTDDSLRKNVSKRDGYNDTNCKRTSDGCIEGGAFYPKEKSGMCQCGVSIYH